MHHPPIGAAVVSTESGWTGVVVRHARASIEDRPHKKIAIVRWDKNGVEGRVRPGRLKRRSIDSWLEALADGRFAKALRKPSQRKRKRK